MPANPQRQWSFNINYWEHEDHDGSLHGTVSAAIVASTPSEARRVGRVVLDIDGDTKYPVDNVAIVSVMEINPRDAVLWDSWHHKTDAIGE